MKFCFFFWINSQIPGYFLCIIIKLSSFMWELVHFNILIGWNRELIFDYNIDRLLFIIANNEGIKWKQSFEIGCARLMDKFHQKDPIPSGSIDALNAYLESSLTGLFAAAAGYTIEGLIGASGAFETYAEVIELDKGTLFDLKKTKHYEFKYNEFLAVTEKLIRSSHQERLNTKGIIPIRIDMIVVASLLTRFIIEKLNIYNVVMSTSSLKEGVLAELMG